jgi:hypothetical protein
MIVGGEQPEGKGGVAFLYESSDLYRWKYVGPFTYSTNETGWDWNARLLPFGRHALSAFFSRQDVVASR